MCSLPRLILPLALSLACAVVAPSHLSAASLIHRYSFSTNADDSIGGANGTLQGGATISGGAVVLDGSSGYVYLPNDILAALNSVTIEAWLTDNYSVTRSRIFDFGNSTAGEDVPANGTFNSGRRGTGGRTTSF
jgi:hypothetical protein